jgi:hypothetical protein
MTINNADPERLTQRQPDSQLVSESVDPFDRKLVEWFGERVVWSGTAAELLIALKAVVDGSCEWWPPSSKTLIGHIESHQEKLRSLGLDVLPPCGYPRIISVRASKHEQARAAHPMNATTNGQESPTQLCDASVPNSESDSENTLETLLAMLRTLAASESPPPSTMSRLASAPANIRTALKKAWTKR